MVALGKGSRFYIPLDVHPADLTLLAILSYHREATTSVV